MYDVCPQEYDHYFRKQKSYYVFRFPMIINFTQVNI